LQCSNACATKTTWQDRLASRCQTHRATSLRAALAAVTRVSASPSPERSSIGPMFSNLWPCHKRSGGIGKVRSAAAKNRLIRTKPECAILDDIYKRTSVASSFCLSVQRALKIDMLVHLWHSTSVSYLYKPMTHSVAVTDLIEREEKRLRRSETRCQGSGTQAFVTF
jgi:hypothetical protein